MVPRQLLITFFLFSQLNYKDKDLIITGNRVNSVNSAVTWLALVIVKAKSVSPKSPHIKNQNQNDSYKEHTKNQSRMLAAKLKSLCFLVYSTKSSVVSEWSVPAGTDRVQIWTYTETEVTWIHLHCQNTLCHLTSEDVCDGIWRFPYDIYPHIHTKTHTHSKSMLLFASVY